MNTPAPVTLDQVSYTWIETRREVGRRDGFALRAGAGNRIEIKSLTTNDWLTLSLPRGALAHTTAEARDLELSAPC